MQAQSAKITSDISIKIEFVAKLPNTVTPQRCIVNVTLDSALPVVNGHRQESVSTPPLGLLMWMAQDWRTVSVSIDFVDYLLAKSFVSIADEWFKSLDKIKQSAVNKFLLQSSRLITSISSQVGRVGCATFLLMYCVFTKQVIALNTAIVISAIAMIIWSIVSITMMQVNANVGKCAAKCVMPSAILLNATDEKIYGEILEESKSALGTVVKIIGSTSAAIGLNVAASYLFVAIHG